MSNLEETADASNSQTEVTINRPGRILFCSDGVVEDFEEEKAEPLNTVPQTEDKDPQTLSWGPWFSHYAWKSGTVMLNAVDYAGESLADFFGVTTPKYQIEIDEYERLQEEKKQIEEESAGWVKLGQSGDIPLVLNEPVKTTVDKAEV